MSKPELSITICSWNTVQDLRICLQSLREVKDEADFEVIVIENASTDGSAEMAQREFPEFRTLVQSENLGFTRGHNLALQQRKGRHAALLNSDTVVHPGAIRTVLQYLEQDPAVGIIGPKLLNPDGSLQYSCRRFPNPVAAAFRNTPLGKLLPNNRFTREYLMQDWGHDEPRRVDWVSGAALFLREETLQAVGGLDPDFFMYCEDVDICKRAWEAGFEVVYLPTAVITHAIGRSTDKVANRMIVRFHRSMMRYYVKHELPKMNWLARPPMALFAAGALSVRASLFLAKNLVDEVRRRMGRA